MGPTQTVIARSPPRPSSAPSPAPSRRPERCCWAATTPQAVCSTPGAVLRCPRPSAAPWPASWPRRGGASVGGVDVLGRLGDAARARGRPGRARGGDGGGHRRRPGQRWTVQAPGPGTPYPHGRRCSARTAVGQGPCPAMSPTPWSDPWSGRPRREAPDAGRAHRSRTPGSPGVLVVRSSVAVAQRPASASWKAKATTSPGSAMCWPLIGFMSWVTSGAAMWFRRPRILHLKGSTGGGRAHQSLGIGGDRYRRPLLGHALLLLPAVCCSAGPTPSSG